MKISLLVLSPLLCSSLAMAEGTISATPNPSANTAPAPTPGVPSQIAVDPLVSSVSFMPRSSTLSNQDKRKLRDALQPLFLKGAPKQVIIASWGDKMEDSKDSKAGDRGNDTQEELAENRAALLRSTLIGLGAKDIDLYNMARAEGKIGEVSGAGDPVIKDALLRAGQDKGKSGSESNPLVAQIVEKGGLSKAIIILKAEPSTAGR